MFFGIWNESKSEKLVDIYNGYEWRMKVTHDIGEIEAIFLVWKFCHSVENRAVCEAHGKNMLSVKRIGPP